MLVLGASPRLGYENSFTGNDLDCHRGKTRAHDWLWAASSPLSTPDRPRQARHSRSCLTRVWVCIVTFGPRMAARVGVHGGIALPGYTTSTHAAS